MPERDMNPQPNNARRFRIDADPDQTAIDIILPADLPKGRQPTNYRVVKKDIPAAAIGKTYGGKTVKWINNFGIRLRGNFGVKAGGNKQDPFIDEVEDEQFTFDVVVPGPAPDELPTLVYFDGANVQPANAVVDNNVFRFSLNIGDPAAGWGGGG